MVPREIIIIPGLKFKGRSSINLLRGFSKGQLFLLSLAFFEVVCLLEKRQVKQVKCTATIRAGYWWGYFTSQTPAKYNFLPPKVASSLYVTLLYFCSSAQLNIKSL